MVSPKLLLIAVLCSAVKINSQQLNVSLENKDLLLAIENDFSKNQIFKNRIESDKRVVSYELINSFPEKNINETIETKVFGNSFFTLPVFFACTGVGAIKYQKWNNISGSSVSNLTSNINYPNNPSVTGTRTLFVFMH